MPINLLRDLDIIIGFTVKMNEKKVDPLLYIRKHRISEKNFVSDIFEYIIIIYFY